jgi:hypothetical protein
LCSGLFSQLLFCINRCGLFDAYRAAIKEKIGSGTLVDGIFLDGGGSSQMQCAEYSFSGDGRVVREMVRLINK